MTVEELRAALVNPNVKAFLRVIRAGETGQTDDAYRTMFGGEHFDGFADHPRRIITRGSLSSSAAGAYQFLSRTWDGLVKQYGFPDFSPACQDEAAVALIAGRRALDDVIAGRIEAAISKCNREWASLPGSPYGQPTRTLAQALATYAEFGGLPGTDSPEPQTQQTQQTQPAKEPAMFPIPVLISLASSLIDAFTPLAKEKVTSALARHTDTPEAAAQIASSVIDAAKAATGLDDPLAAIVAAKADPVAMTNIESGTLDTLSALAPMLDKIAELDRGAWAAEESSRDAATARAAAEPNDQDTFLTRSIVLLTAGLLIGIGAMIGILAYLKVDAGTMIGLFATLAGGVATKFSTRYDHRYGSSRSSSAKDVVMGQIASKQ